MRIGIVGSGFMGRTHGAAWAHTPATVAGVLSADAASARALAQTCGAEVFEDLDALLDAVDVVDICTPTHLHDEQVIRAAARGKHVICEKPLALTAERAQEMARACQAAGVMLLVGHVVRFFPEYARAKEIVSRGEIGRVAVVRLTRASFKPMADQPTSWFHDPAKSGGMMMDLMIHDYDYARWVAGEVETVYAKNIRGRWPNAPADYALVVLRHTSGALSHIEGGWVYPKPIFRTALEIAGSGGLIEHPAESSTPLGFYLYQRGGDQPDIAVPASPLSEDPYTMEIKHFYNVLTGAETPRVTAQDGVESVRIAQAAIESARTGRPVKTAEVA